MTWKELKGNERKGNENINLSGKVGPLDLVPPYQSLFGSELTFLFTTPVLVSSGQSIAQLRCQFLTECRPTSLPLLRNGKPTARAIWHGKERCLSDFESETVFVSFICWCSTSRLVLCQVTSIARTFHVDGHFRHQRCLHIVQWIQ